MHGRLVAVSAALAVVCCSNGGASPAPSAVLKTTTLAVVPGEIVAFAQDGPRLVWLRSGKKCGGRVVLFDLRNRQRVLLERRRGPSCTYFGLEGAIAIGGDRVVWEAVTAEGNEEFGERAVTAATTDRRNRDVGEIHTAKDPERDYDWPPALVAGDGSTLVFYSLCSDVDLCGTRRDVWSGVRKIVGGKASRFFEAELPLALAAAGSDVAALEELYPCPCNYGPRWSPDGTRIAWSRVNAIYVMNADGSSKRRVSRAGSAESERFAPDSAESPRWSPDGSKLAYGYRRDSQAPSEVHVVNADGSADRLLTVGSQPRWSSSGRKLSFVRSGDVWTINSDGSGAKRLTSDAQAHTGGAEWSPDGTRLVAARDTGLYVIRTDGSGQTRIVRGEPFQNFAPQWSPAGAQIAWTHRGRVAVVGADGSGLRELADGANPAWSPDGTRIAFDNVAEGAAQVFVIPAAGGAATALPQGGGDPSWSPDGSTIVFGDNATYSADGYYNNRRSAGIYRVAPDGSTLKKLAPDDRTGVEVRDVRTGARTGSFVIRGDAYAMALSRSLVAVLMRTPPTEATLLQVYRPRTGALVASIPVPSKTESDLAVSPTGIVVFQVGTRIYASDVRTRAIRTIAIARTTPIGLSIYGRRVAWAESRGRRSVIKALVLPARSS
jgi:Tol biopolymer transport system component